jgi:RNA recognition motif-containing protein
VAEALVLVYTLDRCAAAGGALASDIGSSEYWGAYEAEERPEGETTMASKLYVGGLSYSTTSETLREYFAQCGTVESASVITDKFSGQSRGFGFVEMATAEEAQRAISELNGKDLDGRKITVNVSNPRTPGSGGGRGPGGPRGGGRGPGGPRGGGGDRGAYGVPPSKKPFRW